MRWRDGHKDTKNGRLLGELMAKAKLERWRMSDTDTYGFDPGGAMAFEQTLGPQITLPTGITDGGSMRFIAEFVQDMINERQVMGNGDD